MLYSEFIQGTGCRENDHNYKVYRDLEVMYMNSNLSKEEIYEYGKKLVDNSKAPEQIELEKELKQQIKEAKEEIKYLKNEAERYQSYIDAETDTEWIKEWKNCMKRTKEAIRLARRRISDLNLVI